MAADDNNTQSPQDILRKMEIQQKQIELNVRFKKNMELFSKIAPNIYESFKDYEPVELGLSYSASGYIELVNFELNNKSVYGEDPEVFADKQISKFLKNPTISKVNFDRSQPYNPNHFHLDLVNEVLDEFNEDIIEPTTDTPMGLMIMTGCGLGYQISKIIDRCDIYGLCIFDPHKDSFFASLHTVDWAPIIEHFNQSGRMIKLCIGMTPEKTMTHLKLITATIGLHNVLYTFIYRHLNSTEEKEFIELYKKQFHLNSLGLGFFDDEQISLAHSIKNVSSNIPLLKDCKNSHQEIPAFIIGNGPSLDSLGPFLKENKNGGILFSCGTSLGSLYKMGIKPDIHVEMERILTPSAWLEKGTSADFREGITLVGLNNVHPKTYSLFEKCGMALKENDLGTSLIQSELSQHSLQTLNYCNPTVTNCALSLAITLGFKTIYLIGVDLGMLGDEDHHAKGSLHFEFDKKKLKENNYSGSQYSIEGNFVDSVNTTATLDSSRVNMEQFLNYHHKVTAYNPNNGAKIKGTVPIHVEDLPKLKGKENTKTLVKNDIEQLFLSVDTSQFYEKRIHKKYLQVLYNLKPKLQLPEKIESFEDIFVEQNRIYRLIKTYELQNPSGAMLLRGSIDTFLGLATKFCQFSTKDNLQSRYSHIRDCYHRLLQCSYKVIRENAFMTDETQTFWQKDSDIVESDGSN